MDAAVAGAPAQLPQAAQGGLKRGDRRKHSRLRRDRCGGGVVSGRGTGRQTRLRKQIALLGAVAAGMFGFAFALVPLYNIFCEITGLNGRTSGQTEPSAVVAEPAAGTAPDAVEREVTVQFIAHVSRGMPWEFRPTESRMRVRLGEVAETQYFARNFANRMVTGQAVPSVTPGYAARYLHKVECFCFTQQHLEASEEIDMPVYFYVGEDLPSDIGTVTLSYTMYPVSSGMKQTPAVSREAPGAMPMDHSEHSL